MNNVLPHKDMSGCSISGVMSENGDLLSGELIIRSIARMHERANGLGGGFAAYGIYPQNPQDYAIHVMYDTAAGRKEAESALDKKCTIRHQEPIPTRQLDSIKARPILWRYFVQLKEEELARNYDKTEQDVMVDLVMEINTTIRDAFIFSSGRNMGVFKGLGYPEQIGDFFRLDEYAACIWTAHGRFPTNTTGWWGGAHPFGLLEWSVVHNGEISSYGINRRYLDNFGYHCAFQTDTEVITYMFDLLVRKHGLPFETACMAMAPPFWEEIERMSEHEATLARTIRNVYGGALLNGPFSVLVGHSGGMIGFNDRIKLRPMVAARDEDRLYVASEEAAIREICPEPETLWRPEGGEPVVGSLHGGVI
ncbi:MAG: class II glutamine amidotransferase [Candidatus Brocadiia bacterium]